MSVEIQILDPQCSVLPLFISSFIKLYKVENLVDLVKQMSISGNLNMDVLGSQADVSSPFDTGVRSNQLDDQDENIRVENIRRSRSENTISQGCDEAYVKKRKYIPTPRWLQYQSDQLQERRTMLNRRIIRKSSAVDSLLIHQEMLKLLGNRCGRLMTCLSK